MSFFSIAAHLEIVPTQMQIISLKMELEVRITVMVTNLIFYETGQLPFKKLIFTGGRRDNFGLNPVEGGESEPEDITEDNMIANSTTPCTTFFPANQTATTSFQNQQNQASRRVAPVMGNRGLESQRIQHERSRTKSKVGNSSKEGSSSRSRGSPRAARKLHNQESAGQVVALDERNLKRAVNRYGTMPKGARIGAYLESLRQSGMTPEPITEQGVESDAMVDQSGTSESMDRSMVGKPNKANQMLRSNSSHGGFSSVTSSGANLTSRNSPSNSLVKRVQQGSLERAYGAALQNCTSASATPVDFEFPPPPADLPPPCSSPSPRSTKRNFDKENLPERLERTSSSSSKPSYQIDNSPMSPLSENRTLGSPAVGSLSSPGSTLDHDHKRNTNKSEDAIKPFQQRDKIKADQVVEPVESGAGAAPADMLVNELFESFKAKSNKAKAMNNPSEGVEDKSVTAIDFKANLRKVKKPLDEHQQTQKEIKANQIDFKSNLKKKSESNPTPLEEPQQPALVDFKAKLRKSTASPSSSSKVDNKDEMDPSSASLDFKARLRKVSDSKDSSCKSPIKDAFDSDKKAQEKRESIDSADASGENNDDKRKSTGSISSLRKMWESSTPKAIDSPDPGNAEAGKLSNSNSTVKFEKRVWPPVPNTETEKPMVPVKPTVKPPAPTTKPPPPKEPLVKPPPKPAMAVKPNVCNIYAAPTVATARAKPPIASRPTLAKSSSPGITVPTETAHSGSGSGCSSSAETSDKEELLRISNKLETSIGKESHLPS